MENILIYGIIGLFVLIIVLGIWVLMLSKRIRKMMLGKGVQSLESTIVETNTLSKKMETYYKKHDSQIINLEKKLQTSIQKISVVRFDALSDTGGKQSFALGLLDNHKNGVVISSMYTRNHVNIFAKEIINGESKHKLTQEEQEVISQ